MRTAVRVAEESDVSTLAHLRRAWMEENAGGPIDDPDFERAFAEWWATERDTRTFFLLEADGLAVGMANVKRYVRMPATGQPSAGQWGYVGNVFVLEARRDAGLGHVLMDEVLAWAGREGLVHLRLAPSPRSVPFYARLGYQPGAVVELDPPG
jgi:GNAT superfamily N-acetyltransferase